MPVSNEKDPGTLTNLGQDTDKDKTPELLQSVGTREEMGEGEMDQLIQDQETKDAQKRDAGE